MKLTFAVNKHGDHNGHGSPNSDSNPNPNPNQIKGHLRRLVALAKVMRLAELQIDSEADEKDQPPRSRDQVYIHHIDDKSSIDDPSVRLQAGSELHRYARSLNGQTDFVTEEFFGYVCENRDHE